MLCMWLRLQDDLERDWWQHVEFQHEKLAKLVLQQLQHPLICTSIGFLNLWLRPCSILHSYWMFFIMLVSLPYLKTCRVISLSHTFSVPSVVIHLQCVFSSPSSVYKDGLLSAVCFYWVWLHCVLLQPRLRTAFVSHKHIRSLEVIETPHLTFSFSLSSPSQHALLSNSLSSFFCSLSLSLCVCRPFLVSFFFCPLLDVEESSSKSSPADWLDVW